MAIFADFGIKVEGTVLTDASAAHGMAHRESLGRTKHIEVQYLWIQQETARTNLRITKVGTHDNLADILTNNVPSECLARHPRTAKLTPYKVALGPKRYEKVGNIRIIFGRYIDGEDFWELDEQTKLADAHQRSFKPWTGATMFADVS